MLNFHRSNLGDDLFQRLMHGLQCCLRVLIGIA